ncbi:acidic proline-rich protein PRP25-like [Phocoena phocoena]|uniref:acidic proline-rich protein PRP25-like n=1 Tax=Phocoena phocoena TaxID=9742 RepID=UPI003306EF47
MALRLMQPTPDIATTPERLPKKGAASHSKRLPCIHPYKFCSRPHPGTTSLAPFSRTSEPRPGAFPNKACLSSPPFLVPFLTLPNVKQIATPPEAGSPPKAPPGAGSPPEAPPGAGSPPEAPPGAGSPPEAPPEAGSPPEAPPGAGSPPEAPLELALPLKHPLELALPRSTR